MVATPFVVAGSLLLILSIQLGAVKSANPFGSNVVALTRENWNEEVLSSPHAVFVNICRDESVWCQRLQPVRECRQWFCGFVFLVFLTLFRNSCHWSQLLFVITIHRFMRAGVGEVGKYCQGKGKNCVLGLGPTRSTTSLAR